MKFYVCVQYVLLILIKRSIENLQTRAVSNNDINENRDSENNNSFKDAN
jgi:hypothetical protein